MNNTQLMFSFPDFVRKFVAPSSEVAIDSFFPEEEADRLAKIESYNKHLFRPNTYLHKWWARRSGVTFRYILKQLSTAHALRNFYTPRGLEGLTILDPMMGGATTLHEAIRLGANVIGYDVDPIPVLQARATLTEVSLHEKQVVFNTFFEKLDKKLSPYFNTSCPRCHEKSDMQFLLYGLRRQINNEEAVFVDSFLLRAEPNGEKKTILDFYPSLKITRGSNTWTVIDKEETKKSGISDKNSELLKIPFMDRYVPLVMMGKCAHHGQFFKAPDHRDLQIIDAAASRVAKLVFPVDNGFMVPQGPKSNDLLARGVTNFLDLFSPRQRIYLSEAKRCIDETAPEHRLWLALLVSTSLEFNSMLCGYKGVDQRRPGAIRHVFSHHAYSFPWTALENNPVFKAKTSGTLLNLFQKRILKAGIWARGPVERRWTGDRWDKVIIDGELDLGQECESLDEFKGNTRAFIVRQNDSSVLLLPDQSVDYVVTDPPYFDNVQYSDLSHFFRCWLRWFLPEQADWHYQPLLSAVAESQDNETKFGDILAKIWQECHRVLVRPHGRLIFTYHHWRASAWSQLTIALASARFRLMNSYVVHSENPISVHIRSLRALKHDAILVLKPRDSDDERRWAKPEKLQMDDSEIFCRGCAQYLGWILDQDFNPAKIHLLWKDFIGTD
jgi:DNA modification methylase